MYINPKIGEVIHIPSESAVVISAGNAQLQKGDEVCIVQEGPDMTNPKTGAKIGRYDILKARLSVTECFDAYSVCQKLTTSTKKLFPPTISPLLEEREYVTINKIPVDPNQISGSNIEINTLIQIGDTVIKG